MTCLPKCLTTEVQSCRFIYYGCQLYISISWGDILDLSESCPESCAGRIFAQIAMGSVVFNLEGGGNQNCGEILPKEKVASM